MKKLNIQKQSFQYLLQGFLWSFTPLTLLSCNSAVIWLTSHWQASLGITATLLMFSGIGMIFRYALLGRILSATGILLNTLILYPVLSFNPALTLFYSLVSLGGIYYLVTARLRPAAHLSSQLQLQHLLGNAAATVLLTAFSPLFGYDSKLFLPACLITGNLLVYNCCKYWLLTANYKYHPQIRLVGFCAAGGLFLLYKYNFIILPLLLMATSILLWSLHNKHTPSGLTALLLNHPARSLSLTFLMLSFVGTLLLRTPLAMQNDLSVADAAFTSVSASCVTGLTVIDISRDLSCWGRLIILLLIQLGGLGIMTLTSLALHSLGRLTLQQEQLITAITQDHEHDVLLNLQLIVRFTLLVETAGAGLLTWGFYHIHGDWLQAMELGIFTSISAFCNAGFFPGAGNLTVYNGESLLLSIIAAEIILGGMAPAVTWSFLRNQTFRQLDFVNKLVLLVTAFLLLGGTFLLLLFEWNGLFAALPWPDKLVNGFFMSATLRTAGFNTVNLTTLSMPSYMLMLVLMFIGGSPGGTAGGVKTTTLAVLMLIFRAAIRHEDTVIIDKKRVPESNLIQAGAIFMAAASLLMAILLMLTATQSIALQKLLFEAVSALGTVGLTLGATGELDAVGKIIIMLAMFAGRIGPLTLFLMLSEKQNSRSAGYPPVKIPLG